MPAANPMLGEAAFDADGETFTLAYDIPALILAEDASGWDMPVLLDRLERGNLKALRAVVWAGLQKHHPCNLLRATEIIAAARLNVVGDAMRKGIALAFPKADPDAPANPPAATNGTGSAGSAGPAGLPAPVRPAPVVPLYPAPVSPPPTSGASASRWLSLPPPSSWWCLTRPS